LLRPLERAVPRGSVLHLPAEVTLEEAEREMAYFRPGGNQPCNGVRDASSGGIIAVLLQALEMGSTLIRKIRKDLFEPFEGPDIAIAGGCLAEAEHRGGFGVAQLLEVPQGQDFPVEFVHAVEGLL
jgi:hypothetical protein